MDLEQLLIENQNLIYKLTHYFKNYKDKEDLIQAGRVGLIKAYQKYNVSYETKFSTFAFHSILGEMRKFVREDKNLKISREITKINLLIEKATIILSQKLMREPSIDELANFLQIDPFEIAQALNSRTPIMSIDETLSNDGKELNLHEIIKDKSLDIDSLIDLRDAISGLNDFEKQLINQRYYEDITQSEFAKQFNMSQVQVSRTEQKILTKLKNKIAS